MLVEAQAKASFGQHTSKGGLAHFERITPHVVAVQLNPVEGVEEGVTVMASVADKGNDTTPSACSLHVREGGDAAAFRFGSQ